jgi:hypothetical protein
MSQILVMPHADRWAVFETLDGPPIAEFETLEAAKLDARGRAGETGAEVVVHEAGDPHPERDTPDLDPSAEGAGADPISQRTANPRGSEEPRTPQAGL